MAESRWTYGIGDHRRQYYSNLVSHLADSGSIAEILPGRLA
jgi:hypothetical protein